MALIHGKASEGVNKIVLWAKNRRAPLRLCA
ncbi:hypothetical protein [Rhizobium leguminosarum]|nr:hypothetical protein [Rhizobium leguminosarum]